MAVARFYTSVAQPTTLAGGISNTNTSIQVAATTGFPTSYPFTLALDYGTSAEELVDVTNAAGTTLTVTRGVDGTSAQSHSIGAVVRHTSSARDFADIQSHIAATAAVHGVAGTLVGTSDAQTLANKTLTAPAIASATLSGTLSGTPTFSGAPTFSGTPVLSAGAALSGTFTGSPTLSGSPVFSGAPGFTGGGTFSAVRPLFTRGAAASAALGTRVTADTVDRLEVDADGTHKWGSGGAAADTTLYRNAAGELKTDGALTVAGALAGANLTTGAWPAWSPAWTTSTGTHSPAYGNATIAAVYARVGRMIFFSVRIAFGSTTTFGSGTTADEWQWTLPVQAASSFAGTALGGGYGRMGQSVNTAMGIASITSDGLSFQLSTASGQQDGNALANAGLIDALTPWTWSTTGVISVAGFYEAVS